MIGILLGLGSTGLFGLQQIAVRVGMRSRPHDDGLFMSVLVNVILLWPIMLLVSLPAWSGAGVCGLLVAGLLTTWGGRWASFKAVRLIGPSRASAFQIGGPVFAAVGGWVVLDEHVHLLHAAGGLLIAAGFLLLTRSRDRVPSLVLEVEGPDARDAAAGEAAPEEGWGARRVGYAYALLSAALFGFGFVVRKWALLRYPNALAGAFYGAAAALVAVVLQAVLSGDVRRLVDDNLRRVPGPFVVSGVVSSIGLCMQFGAFFFLPAWEVSVLLGTLGLWMLVWSPLFLGREEHLTPAVVAAVLLVTAGAVVLAVAD